MIERDVDCLIIGSGSAGLSCACKIKKYGVEPVIVERDNILGGILSQCIHPGFGLSYFKEDLTGVEFIQRFIDKVSSYNIESMLNTMVLEIKNSFPKKKVIAVNSKDGIIIFNAKTVILAMGCREKTRHNLNIPGTRPAGIYTAGTAQRMINIEGLMPGKEVVILGSGDVGLIMARRFTLEGARVKMVIEILPHLGGLLRNKVQCLDDFNIPLILNHTVVNIHGKRRIEGVTIAKVDKNFKPIKRTEKHVLCDCLILSVGLIPENEISKNAGIKIDSRTSGPYVNENLETTVPGIFACGNVLLVNDIVDEVVLQGEIVAKSAFLHIKNLKSKEKWKNVICGKNLRFVVPQMVSGKKDVKFLLRVKRPVENAVLEILEISKKIKIERAMPGEMLKIGLKKEEIRKAGNKLSFSLKQSLYTFGTNDGCGHQS